MTDGNDGYPGGAQKRYRLMELLGRGGMAEVWRAWDTELGVERAVKILVGHGRALEIRSRRLRAEARAMARANSRHVLKVYDIVVEDGVPFIVMDLVPGGTLDDQLRRRGTLSPRHATQCMIDVLHALEAAHAIGVVHRDVKPSNILIDAEGRCVLADFGIALVDDDPGRQTRTGVTMGSMAFMAPEQRLDAKGVGPTADLYSVATTLYHLLTSSTPVDLFLAEADSPRWMDIPDLLRPILLRATRTRPDQRYAAAAAMRADLEAVMPRLSTEASMARDLLMTGATVGDDDPSARPADSTFRPPAAFGSARASVEIPSALPRLALGVIGVAAAMGLGIGLWMVAQRPQPVTRPDVPAPPGASVAGPTVAAEPGSGAASGEPSMPPGGTSPGQATPVASPAPSPAPTPALAAPRPTVAPPPQGAQASASTARAPAPAQTEPAGFATADITGSSKAAGRWKGSLGMKTRLYLALRGDDARLLGEVWSTLGGQFSRWPVQGSFDAASGVLHLRDVTDSSAGGEYELHGTGTRLFQGTFESNGTDALRGVKTDVLLERTR